MAGTAPAHAAPSDVSEGLGKFLGGQAAGIDLDSLAEVSGAYAENPSGENPLVTNPLGADVLNALNVDLGSSLQLLGDNGLIQLGAVNQYGEGQDNGDARAASGAVSDQGAISVGGSEQFPSDASITLNPLLSGVGAEGLVSDLSLDLGAVSSSIEQIEGGDAVSNYDVASATLNLESPAVGGVYTDLLATVEEFQGVLDGLSSDISDGLDAGIDLGGLASLSTNVDFTPPDLSETLPDSVVGESSGVTVDLTTGAVNVDLETLLAANPDLPNLNDMPANSQLLSGGVVAAISDGVTQAVTDVVTEVVGNLQNTISTTSLGIEADVSLVGGLAGINVGLNADIQEVLDGTAEESLTVETSGLVSALDPLLDFLGLTGPGGVGDIVLNTLGGILSDTLDTVLDLEGVVDGITGPLAEEVVGPVLDIVNQVVSVTVNAQPEAGDLGEGSSTVRAVQVSLLPNSPLATVNLASSTVRGTVAEQIDPALTVDPAEVSAGDSTTASGTGYTPDSTATVQLTDGEGNDVGEPVTVETDGEGAFTTELMVPEGTTPGEYPVVGTDDATGESDQTALSVTEPDAVIDPSVTVDPAEVPVGESTTVEGTGYTPDNTATVQLQDAEGNDVGDPISVETDGEGNFTEDLPVPEGTEPGDYTVVVTDDETDESAEAALMVTEPDAAIDPSVTVDPAEVPAGESTTVEGTGYTSDNTATVQLTDAEGNPVGEPIEGVATDADGALTSTDLPVPEGTEPGDYTVVVTDDETGETADAPLTVTDPGADAAATADAESDANVDASASASASADADASADPAAEAAAQVAADADANTTASADESAAADADADPAAQAAAEAAADEDASSQASTDADSASEAAAQAAAHSDADSDADADESAAADANAAAAAQAAANADASMDASSEAAADADGGPEAEATEDDDADANVDAAADVDASASASASADADSEANAAAEAAAQEAADADANDAAEADASAASDVSADPAAQAAAEAASEEDASSQASTDADSASEAAAQAAAHSDADSDADADESAAADANAAAAAQAAANADASMDASSEAAAEGDASAAAEAAAETDASAAAAADAEGDVDGTEETEADADVDGTDETDAAADVDASASASASADADSEANAAAEAAAQEAADADANDAAEADASAASDVSADPAAQAAAEAASEEDASSEASSEADSSSETAAQASADSQADSAQDADSSAAAEGDASAAAEAAAETDASTAAAADADAAVAGDGEDADAVADGDGAELDPSVTVEPDSVQPEDEVTVSGGDFAPGSSVSVVVTDGGGNEVGTVEGIEVGTDGNFTTAWTVPEGTDAGELTVTATDDTDENITASATFTVTDGTAPAGATADADGDEDEDQGLATTGSGTVLLIGGLSVLLLLLGLATLLIMRNRRMSTTE